MTKKELLSELFECLCFVGFVACVVLGMWLIIR
jgi:hypothetical protein